MYVNRCFVAAQSESRSRYPRAPARRILVFGNDYLVVDLQIALDNFRELVVVESTVT